MISYIFRAHRYRYDYSGFAGETLDTNKFEVVLQEKEEKQSKEIREFYRKGRLTISFKCFVNDSEGKQGKGIACSAIRRIDWLSILAKHHHKGEMNLF